MNCLGILFAAMYHQNKTRMRRFWSMRRRHSAMPPYILAGYPAQDTMPQANKQQGW